MSEVQVCMVGQTKRKKMTQTKLGSFIESLMNVAIGYFVALLSQVMVFPMFGIHVSIQTNLGIGAWFTLISIVRSFVIRRWFNARIKRASEYISGEI